MATLGVNIDHFATIRQARGGSDPDPVHAAIIAELAGAHGITAHLREDRRHMQDRDIYILKQVTKTHLNLEMAATQEMTTIARDVVPWMVTLVPEKREERTTEGGLLVAGNEKELAKTVEALQGGAILISLFIDPDINQIKAAAKLGVPYIELHTGYYANALGKAQHDELIRLREACMAAHKLGIMVNAGHGLNYRNVSAVASLEYIRELNIGHSIVARASLSGLETAIRDMIGLI